MSQQSQHARDLEQLPLRLRSPSGGLNISATSCAEAFGPGPEGWRCGSCANLQAVSVEGATIYYCCIDGGARRVTSAACSRFEEAPLAREIPPPAGVAQSGAPRQSRDAARPFGRPDEMTPEEPER